MEERESNFTHDWPMYNTTGSQENQELISNETVFSDYPPALLNFGATCCIVFTIVGFTGNLISIIALAKCPRVRNATTAFIINLCFADLLFCIFHLPVMAVTYLEPKWDYGDTFCKVVSVFGYNNGAVSLFNLIAITMNRYVLIVHPRKYSSVYRPRYIASMILIIWMLSLLIVAIPFFEVWGKFGYDRKEGGCGIMSKDGKNPRAFLFAVAFLLPLVVFIFGYIRIYWVVIQSYRKTRRRIGYSFTETTIDNPQRLKKFQELVSAVREKKELRVLYMIMIIFITFIVCYFPVFLVNNFGDKFDVPTFRVFAYLGVYFSTCVNPLIYIVMSKEYRQAYIQLFNRLSPMSTSVETN